MSRVVAVVRRLLADPRPDIFGDRPWSLRIVDDFVYASPAKWWL